jgi:predicted outer membrane protein
MNAKERFKRADQLVTAMKDRISRQRAQVERARRSGHPSASAEALQRTLEQSLNAFERHRQRVFERLEAKRP